MFSLLYYDIKATAKKIFLITLILLLFSVAVKLLWTKEFMENFDNSNFYIGNVIRFTAAGLLGAFTALAFLLLVLIQGRWFADNILSNQGQLTNMLPVSPFEIVLSKTLTAFIWSLLSVLTTAFIVAFFLYDTSMLDELLIALDDFKQASGIELTTPSVLISFFIYISIVVTSIVTLCFFSLTFGHCFSSFRNMAVFLSFAGIMLLQVIAIRFLGVRTLTSILGTKDMQIIAEFLLNTVKKLTIINVSLVCFYWLITSILLRNHRNLI